MKANGSKVALILGALAALAGVWFAAVGTGRRGGEAEGEDGGKGAIREVPPAAAHPVTAGASAAAPDAGASAAEAEPQTEEERREAEAEKRVDAFDALTDRWMEEPPPGKEAGLSDANAFVAQFSRVPADRKEECLQRALNLIPDANVMLLAGILLDKSQPAELRELVFNDILNRDESVKKPILQEVFKDKSHPCWADTAWILDATGESPR